MSRHRSHETPDEDNGFAAWGGYMQAKKTKLLEQYKDDAAQTKQNSEIFKNVAIFVNGLTNPSADELKTIMSENGGTFHLYQSSKTTHIIASNLPNVKINKLGSVPIVKPSWITDSLDLGHVIDYRRYLLYTNQSTTQPRLDFAPAPKTASDPRFLEEFYNNSRLHLIATLGTEFKQLVQELRDKSDGTFPGCEKLPKNGGIAHTQTIMHIDMDCFFVSVGLRTRPELRGLPVAVTHARNGQVARSKEREMDVLLNLDRLADDFEVENLDGKSSMSEIASCSYEARQCGVKNGMFLGAAVKLCPDLKTIPYDFEGYKSVSTTLYTILASYTLDIEAVSCDEMYVDVTPILSTSGLSVPEWSAHIRSEISLATGCPCSTGFGANRLQARLATRRAKPNGTFYLRAEMAEDHFRAIPLADLPGVGRATLAKLHAMHCVTCGDVQMAPLAQLRRELGAKMAETIAEQARGVDSKPLCFNYERKSVSAEINYGIRFKSREESLNFLQSLCVEVWQRLSDVKLRARCVTLKMMVRAQDAPQETAKFMGHGICDSLSRSTTLNFHLVDAESVYREARNLYDKLNVDHAELRGMGVQLSKLDKPPPASGALDSFLNAGANRKTLGFEDVKIVTKQKSPLKMTAGRGRSKKMPPTTASRSVRDFFRKTKEGERSQAKFQSQNQNQPIDLNVLKELPSDLREEIMKEYNLDSDAVQEASNQVLPSNKVELNVKKDTKNNKNPFSGLQLSQLRQAVHDWTFAEAEPKSADVQLLGDHLKQLALDREIELLRTIANFLHRKFSELACAWHQAYLTLVDCVQQGMVARYGCTLLVNRSFKCC